MPPLSGIYEWTETPESIVLSVPLKTASRKSVDVYVARTVLKISYPPYLLDLDLAGDAIWSDSGSKAIFDDADGNVLKIRLTKATRGLWGKLLFDGTEKERKRRRDESLRERESWAKDKHEEAKKKRCEEERTTLRKQMSIEQSERQAIEDLKAKEKKVAEEELYKSVELMERQRRQKETKEKERLEDGPLDALASSTRRCRNECVTRGEAPTDATGEGPPAGGGEAASPIDDRDADSRDVDPDLDPSRTDASSANTDARNDDVTVSFDDPSATTAATFDDDDANDDVPEPRRPAIATFRHTPRWFKTPIRESTAQREKDFVARHRPYLKTNRLLNRDGAATTTTTGVEDSDPTWLKSRGDEFCSSGDWRSAINAYSAAVEASDDEEQEENDATTIRCLSNRAACYLRIGEAGRCVADCEEALRRVGNDDDDGSARALEGEDARLRAKLLARMGTAKCLRGEYDAAVADFRAATTTASTSATKLGGRNSEALARDLERVARLRDASKLKSDADSAFGRGNLEEAIDLYTKALGVDGTFVSALSNRAACHLASGDAERCVRDCSSSLELLSDDGDNLSGRNPTSPKAAIAVTSVPRPGTQERRRYVATLLCRRGAARAELDRTEDALNDLKLAAMHVVGDDRAKESIERDVEALELKLSKSQSNRREGRDEK